MRDGAGAAAVGGSVRSTMTESADPVAFGTPFTWSLLAQNDGPAAATGVVVTNTLPVGRDARLRRRDPGQLHRAEPDGDVRARHARRERDPRRSRSTSPARPPAPLHNSAFVTANEVDPVAENNTADVETTITLASCAAPSYSSPVALAVPSFDGIFVEQADLNNDGSKDLVVSMLAGGLAVRLNDGHGNFAAAVPVSLPG